MTSSIHPTVHLFNQQTLIGVWNKNKYKILRKIGEGARGSIYLAFTKGRYVALKISKDSSVVSAEVNALKTLQKVQGIQLGPLLLDVDDAYINQNEKLSFYVMEYINGVPIHRFVRAKGLKWLVPISSQVLIQLHHLHQAGYIFGDLKPENILIDIQTKQVRLIDVGGITKFGRSIREYSTWYDRGYWGMGSRRAEPTYDLFAYAVCMISMDPKVKINSKHKKNIMSVLSKSSSLTPYHSAIEKALKGQYSSALKMKQAIEQIPKRSKSRRKTKVKNNRNYMTETVSIGSIVTIHIFLLYYFLF
ncbi:protein kinase domain-containing protein [Bacillaceae bacterium W0354]